jgi:alpha-D-xyloside xylohydrolase
MNSFTIKNIAGKSIFFIALFMLFTIVNTYSYGLDQNSMVIKVKDNQLTGVKSVLVKFYADDIIQIVASPEDSPSVPFSLIVDKVELPKVEFKIKESADVMQLTTRKLIVIIDVHNGQVTFKNINNEDLLKEGTRQIIPAIEVNEKVNNIKQSFNWADDEALYGLGQHQKGIFNWRSHYVELFQFNTRAIVPFLLSTKGYGILWDNYSYTKFNDDKYGSYIWSEVGDAINYFFIYGPEPDSVINNYRTLTGKAPLFPKWAYGYFQSKERYKSQEEILNVVKEYRSRKIPLDAIVLDWQYWDDGKWGQKSFNKERFPNPELMMDSLHSKYNTHLMISIWPKMSIKSSDYSEMIKHKGFLYKEDDSPFYDAFNPQARMLYWEQANKGLFSKGIDAWWCDATEPEVGGWDLNCDAYKTKMTPKIGSGARYMNAYSLMHSKGIYENQRLTTNKKRVVNLTRSAFAGQQKYATITWSGDIVANWNVFKNQIPAGLNFCMSGLPYWTMDIGGFFVQSSAVGRLGRGAWFRNGDFDRGLADDNYKELYVRWFQFGAFCPIFRSHGTDISREIYRFGEPGTWAYDALLKFDNLRYRLMPYIYSMAWKVTSEGYTLMRGLIMDFRNDPHVYDIDDQFMFGQSILVNPVIKPKETFREVYLPIGSGWYNFWTGKKYSGGQTLDVPTPIDQIPIFIKEGSILPLEPFNQYASESADPIELRIYPGADGNFTLFEDENDNYDYEKGIYSLIKFIWDDKRKTLTISNRKGTFPGMLKERTFKIVSVGISKGAGVDISIKSDKVIQYKGNKMVIKLFEKNKNHR